MSLKRRLWPDSLGARVAVILLAALLLESFGGELLFRDAAAERAARIGATELAEHLRAAERLASGLPPEQRQAALSDLWRGAYAFDWSAEPPPVLAANPDLAGFEADLAEAAAEAAWPPGALHVAPSEEAARLRGSLKLPDGTWLTFSAPDHRRARPELGEHFGPLAFLVACVAVAALISTWMISRPLHRLALAADRAGRDEAPTLAKVEGPREVREVAMAFNAAQARQMELIDERMKALAAVSHDLRTPIGRLRLRSEDIAEPEVRRGVEHDLDEMERFVASILDYLRGGDPEPGQLVDVASLVHTIVDDARDMGGRVDYAGPSRLEAVVPPVKLQRAVLNLVQNALRYGESARVILGEAGGDIEILVEDDGPGLPPDALEAVFKPFYRLDSSRSRDGGGVGLGLTVVRRALRRTGGSIVLENRTEGGLRARMRLPLRRTPMKPEKAEPEKAGPEKAGPEKAGP